MPKNYDFAGYVTKNDVLCSDGVIIKQNAFANAHGRRVPLVWNHNYSTPDNVLGFVELEQRKDGTYGFGHFNETENAKDAKLMLQHGDITSMSIGAKKIKRSGSNVIHGDIYEVSLVLAGANPGAHIDTVMTHGEDGTEEGYIYTQHLIHSSDVEDEILENLERNISEEDEEMPGRNIELTEEDILNSFTDEQLEYLASIIDDEGDDYDDDEYDEEEPGMKHNIFDGTTETNTNILTHSEQAAILQGAITGKEGSFRDYLIYSVNDDVLTHAYDESTQVGGKDFGITNIEFLFPEVHELNRAPKFMLDPNTAYKEIINGVSKSPFSKVRTRYFDIDVEDEKQRARGYVKGTRKIEEVIKILRRETHPTTIYKKQKLDRDDIIEITDFDVVAGLQAEMRMMLEIEIARAILIGDGRDDGAEGKIDEEKIRPILTDDPIYSIKKQYTDASDFAETALRAQADYEGTGSPTLFIDQELLVDVKLQKGTDGRYLNGHIMTNQELEMMVGASKIVATSFLKGKGLAILVNLSDYVVGSTKGGQLTSFNDFDIDFNRYKYLIETRLSGALAAPKSAIVFHKADYTSKFKIKEGATQQGRTLGGSDPEDDGLGA